MKSKLYGYCVGHTIFVKSRKWYKGDDMLKNITTRQAILCKKCCYRDRALDGIVFCPYINRCIKTGKPAEYREGADENAGDNTEAVHRNAE